MMSDDENVRIKMPSDSDSMSDVESGDGYYVGDHQMTSETRSREQSSDESQEQMMSGIGNLCNNMHSDSGSMSDVESDDAYNVRDNQMNSETGSRDESSDESRENEMQLVIDELGSSKYHIVCWIGSGTYGDVYRVKDSSTSAEFAMKIIPKNDQSLHELSLWPELKHPYILPLLDLFHLSSGVACIMPLMKTSLSHIVDKTDFGQERSSWLSIKRWFYEILSGLEYLHTIEVCHLDIKVDNVLISETDQAVLCDFSCIKPMYHYFEREGLPSMYWPPEASTPSRSKDINLVAFDQWSFGMMALETFADSPVCDGVESISEHSSEEEDSHHLWIRDIQPILTYELQEEIFIRSFQNTFYGVQFQTEECLQAREFVLIFLQLDPKKRWFADVAKNHILLGRGTLRLESADDMWVTKEGENI